MDQGLISPLTCGFARVAACWSTKEAKSLFPSNKKLVGNSEFLQKRFSIFEKVFTSRKEAFNVDFRHFNKKILKLESTIDHWNFRRADEKQIFLSTFSISNWRELAFDKKQQHTFTSCQGCYMDFSSALSLFPVKSNYFKKCLSSTPVSVAQKCLQNQAKTACSVEGSSSQFIEHAKLTNQKQPTQRNAVNNAKILYDKINAPFRQIHNIDFSKALAKVDGINLQNKMQKHAKRKGRRENYRKIKAKLEARWKENDADSFLQSRISYNKRQKQRMTQYFETKDQALERTKKRKNKEQNGVVKKKRHSPKPDNIEFNRDALLSEVKCLKEGDKVCKIL